MGLSAIEYLSQIKALLPRGDAWTREIRSNLSRTLEVIAEALARIDAHGDLLVRESDPRRAVELLSDWERLVGTDESAYLYDGTILLPPGEHLLGEAGLASFSRPSIATYIDGGVVKHVNANVPRFLSDGRLLIESEGTNLLRNSEAFDSSAWSKNVNITVTPNAYTAPDGTATAASIKGNSGTAIKNIYQQILGGDAGTWTSSFFLRAGAEKNILLSIMAFDSPNVAGRARMRVNLETGAVSNVIAEGVFATAIPSLVQQLSDGWWRIAITGELSSTVPALRTEIFLDGYTSTPSEGEIYVWGAQLEAAAAPSSYIPTESSAATRAADVAEVYKVRTQQERRDDVVQRLITTGGQSRRYFIDLARALGYEITITEFFPFRAGHSRAGDPITNTLDWRYSWRVNAPETTFWLFRAGVGAAGEPLRKWGNSRLEGVIRKYAPAHTNVIFGYGGNQ